MARKHFSQKQKLSILRSAKQTTVKDAANIAEVHFTTVYDWKKQFEVLGEQGFLEYKVPRPGRGIKKISPQKEQAVVDTWGANPEYGPGQVRNQLRRQRVTMSTKSVRNIMVANGYKIRKKKTDSQDSQRFEASRPLELAQMDILEFFINKLKVYVILILDDYSRFILGWSLLEKSSMDEVIHTVDRAVNRYGKMEEILTDRGFVFYSWHGVNRFEKYLEMLGIDHTHASAHHPKTLGKVEACNKTIKNELLKQRHFSTAREAMSAVNDWVDKYNYRRTHQGIGGLLVPAERFHGQSEKILSNISRGVDIANQTPYSGFKIDRTIFNLVIGPRGDLTLHLMGHPIRLTERTC